MQKKRLCLLLILSILLSSVGQGAKAESVPISEYIITSDSMPYQNLFTNYSTYNSSTRGYYVLRSYLEQLERLGGGTLTLKAGTYIISNTLYVPSHVTLRFEDGVIIKKGDRTDTVRMAASKSIFQLAAPSKSKIAGAYQGYSGENGIRFLGEGKVIFDLNYIEDSFAIIMGHNSNILISGITFQNMHGGHFIEMDASKDVIIEKNNFINSKPSKTGIKEAINLDTPDKKTQGFHAIWSNFDCTPNKNVIIQNNVFQSLERAIGTHKYSEGKYHEDIKILNNQISDTVSDAIRVMNWTDPVIQGNFITKAGKSGNNRAILASGVINPVFTANTITETSRPIQIMPWKNSDYGSEYAITYNEISSSNIDAMLKNFLIHVKEPFIRINKTYQVYDKDTVKYYFSTEYNKE